MIWKPRDGEFKDCNEYWRPFFCLWPRRVQGYKVWLSSIEAYRRYYTYDNWFGAIKRGYWMAPREYRLTEAQAKRLGIKW